MTLDEIVEQVKMVTMMKDSDADAVNEVLTELGVDTGEVRRMLVSEANLFVEGDPTVLDAPPQLALAAFGVHCLLIGLYYGKQPLEDRLVI